MRGELSRFVVDCEGSEDEKIWELALNNNDTDEENQRSIAMEECGENVIAPVESFGIIGNNINNNGKMVNITEILRKGFLMNWIASDCTTCEDSGGHCGFNSSTFHFRCFCPDMPHSRSCKPGFNEKDIELFLKNNGNLAPKRYKYSDIKKMTKSFSESLGKGGYGSVYKGKVSDDGRLVAVKMLNESKGNGDEFMNEVASISRTSHINVVTLLGFCFEGSKRALIYEFMPNGSLEKFIQNKTSSSVGVVLGSEKLFQIALGIARGLEYLHQGCNMRILHFDIKPHNILLDMDFNPKISDFGLAKLCPNRSSIVSMLVARGTIGYIAPEVFSRNFGEVSHKSDVYSYGMVILEIAGATKNIDPKEVDRSSEVYFPQYIYRQLELEAENGRGNIEDEDEGQFSMKKLIIVGLWCVQTDPKDRPSMKKVLEMLEGNLEVLQVPPKSYISSPQRFAPSFSTSESI
ncbi:hypothetical protein MIMGU_mgv1a005995mg [Erythranthe guttata]|uniref:Protein kinase domain-containing protein n=1 Tax=Erythranthe guttata TaxID=4155 RepID=A0A022RPC0_ERYGU|nr:hypothetical protein MIMGU_mgv1a005995mg [Erythranthe guttata]